MPRRRTSLYIDEELSAGLKQLKARDGMPEAEAVRRAVAEYLEKRGIALAAHKTDRKRAPTRKRP